MRDEDLAEAKFSEHVNNGLHWRMIRDGDGCQIEDSPQLNWRRSVPGRRDVGRKQN